MAARGYTAQPPAEPDAWGSIEAQGAESTRELLQRLDAALALDGVTQIRPALCTERIGPLSPARMREVCAALAIATAC